MPEASNKQRLQKIQERLGVEADGVLGPATLSAIEALLPPGEDQQIHADYSLITSRKGLRQLVKHEISSEGYYKRFLSKPVWPKGRSGITIGIGYDLGYNTPAQIKKDWAGQIPESDVAKLTEVAGLKGTDAQRKVSRVGNVRIPLEAARSVFYASALPRYAAKTRKAYPGAELLPADAQSALLSLVYNRGASISGPRRTEMKEIRGLVAGRDLPGIAGQIRAMKRLWIGTGLDGLLSRRDDEAALVENADRLYEPAELVYV